MPTPRTDRWATIAAALPQEARALREEPFWRVLVHDWGWRRVADAGCGAGFHLALLRALGVEAVGFDLTLAALTVGRRQGVAAADVADPPLRPASVDAVLCLGNTISLLADRDAQGRALASLGRLLRPRGVLLVQGEDVGALVARGAVARTRTLADGSVHLRVFERRGRRVRLLSGVGHPGQEVELEGVWVLPTSPRTLTPWALRQGLNPVALPVAPPGTAPSWWLALTPPVAGS